MEAVPSLVLTVLLTLVNGFFSMSEMALSLSKRVLLEHEAKEGDIDSMRVLTITHNDSDFLAAIQVGITLVGFMSSALAATSLSQPLSEVFQSLGLSQTFAQAGATAIITLVVSFFSIVIGELVPKRIALADPERIAKRVSRPIARFLVLAKPLVFLTSACAQAVSHMIGITSTDARKDASEDEIRYLVTDSGELSEEEKTMIHDIFDLGDTIAREVMIPRVDMSAVEDTTCQHDVIKLMQKTGYSRIPIFHKDIDHVVGIAHIKDLVSSVIEGADGSAAIAKNLRIATFVPDTKDIIPLLSEMRAHHEQMVIVVDEYGGTAGIITIEDIVEEIVGEIEDEFDPDNRYLTQLNDREWLVDGRYSIDDARDLGWPIPEDTDFETVAGFILDIADGLPKPKESFDVAGYRFKVVAMRRKRVSKLRVTAPAPAPRPHALKDAPDQSSSSASANMSSSVQ